MRKSISSTLYSTAFCAVCPPKQAAIASSISSTKEMNFLNQIYSHTPVISHFTHATSQITKGIRNIIGLQQHTHEHEAYTNNSFWNNTAQKMQQLHEPNTLETIKDIAHHIDTIELGVTFAAVYSLQKVAHKHSLGTKARATMRPLLEKYVGINYNHLPL